MKKILILNPILPYPPDDGGRLRTYHLIRSLGDKCELDLASFYLPEEDIESAAKFYSSLCKNIFFIPQRKSDFSIWSIFNVYRISNENKKEVNEIIRKNGYDLIIAEKVIMLSYIKSGIFRNYKIAIDSWAVDSNITLQIFLYEKKFLKRWFYFFKYLRHLFSELYLLSKSDYMIAITDKIHRFYEKIFKKKIYLIQSAVDVEYYKPAGEKIEKGKMVFVGIMNYYPNIDAAVFFVKEVLPKIRGKIKFKFYIVGKNPVKEVAELDNASDVIVTGQVEDVRKYFNECEVVVVPLRMGSGLRNKVIQAMACGKTVIATSEACEGLDVKDGENILIANTVEEFVDKIILVFNNEQLRIEIEKNARKYVEENLSYDIIKEKWINMYEEIFNSDNYSRQT